MTHAELKVLPSSKLFACCASHFDDDQYWEEFVRRFNPCLTLTVYQAYRRFIGGGGPPFVIVSDLIQEGYLNNFRNKCSALGRYRGGGGSETEAEVYLMHIAASVTIDRLRRQHSLKRYVRTESIDSPKMQEELRKQWDKIFSPYTDDLAENDVIKV